MDALKRISEDAITEIVADTGFDSDLILKDYYLTVILYLIKDVNGIYFKGGTALQKIFLNYSRISEDIDFTLIRPIGEVRKEIKERINQSGFFGNITQDKDVKGFLRLVVSYTDFSGKESRIFIDLNEREKIITLPEKHEIAHFFKESIPVFSVNTLSQEEMIAEKLAATITRNKPRDHYDIYQIIKRGMPINSELAKKKCIDSGVEFSIIHMFNQGQKLHRRWNEDLVPLLVEEVTFQEVMASLARHFHLKEEKGLLKDNQ
jgi:predicted nucleotidyltransferase component of viral defense system